MSDLDPRLTVFKNFLYLAWKHLNLPDPTPVQYDIADFLQYGPKRRMVQAFRGIGKSWVCATYVAWRLLLNPEERVMIVSANGGRAEAFAHFLKGLLREMPILQHLQAREGQRDSITNFDVGPSSIHQAPSVKCVGITGQLTGSRATLIIADDVEIPKNSLTVVMREKLAEAVTEFGDVVVPDVGEIVYLGTPQCEESLYNKHLPARGYGIRVWPARIPAKVEKYGNQLAPLIHDRIARGAQAGEAVDTRFSDADLRERELEKGRSGWALQYMLDTQLSDAERYPLRCADFMTFACGGDMGPVKLSWATSPELIDNQLPVLGFSRDRYYKPIFVSRDFSDWQGTVMAVDPHGKGQDETGYAVVRMLNGNLYVPECKGIKGGYDPETLLALAHVARRNKVNRIIVEENYGGGMFVELFKPVLAKVYQCTVEEVWHNVQKERRIIDVLEPLMNQHRVVIDPAVIEEDAKNFNEHPEEKFLQYSLIYQLTHITKEKGCLRHYDRLDALAMAAQYWVEAMAKDDTRGVVEAKQKKMDVELEKYMADLGVVYDSSDTTPRWF